MHRKFLKMVILFSSFIIDIIGNICIYYLISTVYMVLDINDLYCCKYELAILIPEIMIMLLLLLMMMMMLDDDNIL